MRSGAKPLLSLQNTKIFKLARGMHYLWINIAFPNFKKAKRPPKKH